LRACSETIRKTLDIVKSMLKLADEGDAVREDVGCGILWPRRSARLIPRKAGGENRRYNNGYF
jgi:hypothetical protein